MPQTTTAPTTQTTTPRTRVINARYGGICTATGDRYTAGAPIVRGPNGWEISRWEEDHDTACPPGCPCYDTAERAPDHGDHDAPDYADYNEDFYMTADHYDF